MNFIHKRIFLFLMSLLLFTFNDSTHCISKKPTCRKKQRDKKSISPHPATKTIFDAFIATIVLGIVYKKLSPRYGGDFRPPIPAEREQLFKYIEAEDTAAIKSFLEHTPSLASTPRRSGEYPLSFAVAKESKEVVLKLIASRANVNALGKPLKSTALHRAAATQNSEIAQILLNANANPDILDKNDHSPLALAFQIGGMHDTSIVQLLTSVSSAETIKKAGTLTREDLT